MRWPHVIATKAAEARRDPKVRIGSPNVFRDPVLHRAVAYQPYPGGNSESKSPASGPGSAPGAGALRCEIHVVAL